MQLTPGKMTLAELEEIYRGGDVTVDPAFRPGVEAALAVVTAAAAGDAPVYGVNTGFGKLASVRIPPKDTAQLQRNLILSHAAGIGAPLGRWGTLWFALLWR